MTWRPIRQKWAEAQLLFSHREYEYGVLYDFLKDLRPGLLIVGLDFGAAETQAYKCSLSQTGAHSL